MGFYLFKLDRILVRRRRGNIPDHDVITFHIFINKLDRGHGSGVIPAVANNSSHLMDDRSPGYYAYPARNLLNMAEHWTAGPFEIAEADDVSVVYTGTNLSDSGLSSLPHQEEQRTELDMLNYASRIAVGALAGAGVGEVLGRLFSAAFDEFIDDPIGDLIDYEEQGPCNGPVFSDAIQFSGTALDQLPMTSLPQFLWPVISFTRSYSDAETHDTDICGDVAETDVTFSAFRLPYISLKYWMSSRFSGRAPSAGLRRLAQGPFAQPGSTISIKSLFGVLP
jgi:hypothetical protein